MSPMGKVVVLLKAGIPVGQLRPPGRPLTDDRGRPALRDVG